MDGWAKEWMTMESDRIELPFIGFYYRKLNQFYYPEIVFRGRKVDDWPLHDDEEIIYCQHVSALWQIWTSLITVILHNYQHYNGYISVGAHHNRATDSDVVCCHGPAIASNDRKGGLPLSNEQLKIGSYFTHRQRLFGKRRAPPSAKQSGRYSGVNSHRIASR